MKMPAQGEEINHVVCPKCQRPVSYRWKEGFIPEPHNVLVANAVFHTECWEQTLRDNPPGPRETDKMAKNLTMKFDYVAREDNVVLRLFYENKWAYVEVTSVPGVPLSLAELKCQVDRDLLISTLRRFADEIEKPKTTDNWLF